MDTPVSVEPKPVRSLALTIKWHEESVVIHDLRTGEQLCALGVLKSGRNEARLLFKAPDHVRIVREDFTAYMGVKKT